MEEGGATKDYDAGQEALYNPEAQFKKALED
jgi:hypothetical protein